MTRFLLSHSTHPKPTNPLTQLNLQYLPRPTKRKMSHRDQVEIPLSLTSFSSSSSPNDLPPPPYTPTPPLLQTANIATDNLSRAIRDFRENSDANKWGSRNQSKSSEEPLTGFLSWLIWFGQLMGPPEPPRWSTTTGGFTPWVSGGPYGVI